MPAQMIRRRDRRKLFFNHLSRKGVTALPGLSEARTEAYAETLSAMAHDAVVLKPYVVTMRPWGYEPNTTVHKTRGRDSPQSFCVTLEGTYVATYAKDVDRWFCVDPASLPTQNGRVAHPRQRFPADPVPVDAVGAFLAMLPEIEFTVTTHDRVRSIWADGYLEFVNRRMEGR